MDDENNNELYAYPGGKAKSRVWSYFMFRKIKEGAPSKATLDMNMVYCKLCNKGYANKGNTTNLQFHLDKNHKREIGEDFAVTKIKNQPRIDAQFTAPQGRLSTEKSGKLDQLLLKLLVCKALPLSLVDNDLFRNFIRELEPRYNVPSRKTVQKSLEKKNEEMHEKVNADLHSDPEQTISLTHDGWTSMSTQSYDTVTGHFITKEWELNNVVLQTKKIEGQHTGDNIASNIQDTLNDWKLPPPTAITTDNAANEQKAIRTLGLTRFGCYGHRINLVVKKSLEIPSVAALIKKGRKIVTFFHQSSSVNDLLMQKQNLIFAAAPAKIGHKLIMDCPTRWNSTLSMLRRLIEQMPVLVNIANDDGISKAAQLTLKTNCYNFQDQSQIEKIVNILTPFEKATTILCAEKNPTMHKVLPTVSKITKCVAVMNEDEEIIKDMKTKLIEEISRRSEMEDLPLLAAILNPDTKTLPFLNEIDQERAKKLLFEQASQQTITVKKEKPDSSTLERNAPTLPSLPEDDTVKESDEVTEIPMSPIKKQKIMCSDSDDWLEDVCVVGESQQLDETVVQKEVERYLQSSRQESDINLTLLEWWSVHEFLYPRLAKLAKRIHAVPASSVPSERVFSLAGTIVSKKRSRINPALVDMMIFMTMNKKYW